MRRVSVVLLGLLALTVCCSREEEGSVLKTADRPLPDQVISDFRITETSMGKKDWSMKAVEAYLYEKRNVLEAREIEVEFFDEAGEIRSILRADNGRLNRNNDDMEAKGDVVVTGEDGVVLETQSLKWESSTRKIVSDDSVRVLRNRDVLTGWGFRGDPDLGSFSILRDMKATIRATGELGEGGDPNETGTEN